jgi:hypothetical protein
MKSIYEKVIAVMTFVEQLVPDGTPGLQKLDLALKVILKANKELQGMEPVLRDLFALAKSTFNEAKAQFGQASGA